MEWFIKAFIRASLLWFAAGIVLGVGMAVHPPWVVYRAAHAHMNVVGFLTMLVFGVGYQLLPRLFGHPLRSRALAVAHFFLANVGLLGLVAGFLLLPHSSAASRWSMASGGVLFAAGAVLWVWNLWRTFDAADARYQQRMQAEQRQLPTLRGQS
jgi:cbb3-type cytochrome oxidase subunit 1